MLRSDMLYLLFLSFLGWATKGGGQKELEEGAEALMAVALKFHPQEAPDDDTWDGASAVNRGEH